MKCSFFIIITISIFSLIRSQEVSIESQILDKLMSEPINQIFKVWHFLFKKEYQIISSYGSSRFEIFKKNLEEIKQHNSNDKKSWKLGFNQFSDLTIEEFKRDYLKPINFDIDPIRAFNSNGYYEVRSYYSNRDGPLKWNPIDYTQQCGKVRNQGQCGSCYSFSMLNTIECSYAIKTGVIVDLSRQQIVDCNSITGGCNGGNPPAVAFYAKSQGMMTESDYPYVAKQQTCVYNAAKTQIYVDGVETTGKSSANNVIQNSNNIYDILTRGAISISLDADAFKNFKTGIIDLTNCVHANHAVMIVGFGIDSLTNTPYWIIKNSWGTSWGEKGYIRVKVKDDALGNCFIYNNAFRAIKN